MVDILQENVLAFTHFFAAGPKKNTINFFGLELETTSGRVWKKALESNLNEQKMYNTAVGWLIKGALRFAAWVTVIIGVYGTEHLFSF